jgi:radical SAM protein with 4Fe4S-binding SPASM domain
MNSGPICKSIKIKEKSDYLGQLERKLLPGGRPISGQIDLTYRCNLKCQHCFIVQEKDKKELTFKEVISSINKIHEAGCLWLSFSGGEVFLRKDFLDIYAYARKKGFLISILTNGTLITQHTADYLANLSPFCIDITLNGITEQVYEEVTQVKGSFAQVMQAIKLLKERNLPLTLKSNGMKINRDEILKIKQFSEELLGKNRFRLDLALCAGMDGSKKPCKLRLTPDEILNIQNSDKDMLSLCREQFLHQKDNTRLKQGFLFPCGLSSFHIDPYGKMRLCLFIKEPCADIRKDAFPESFKRLHAYFLGLKANVATKCRECNIEYLCRQCPGRALIENGDMEQPVEFFCELAHRQEETKEELLN